MSKTGFLKLQINENVCDYFPEINPDNPPSAFVVYAGLEPLQFTNLFPFWTVDERVREINLKVCIDFGFLLLICLFVHQCFV